MRWRDVLANWENGVVMRYPASVRGKFQWNTSPLTPSGETEFKQRFRTDPALPVKADPTDFQQYIDKSSDPDVVSFLNLSKDTRLVVPMPKSGSYATLRDFIDHAPLAQQQAFWKRVAKEAKKEAKKWGKVWISVHGRGVPYLHVRISSQPKYYFAIDL